MSSNARVSVILTSFNHEKYLKEAIDSVLNQTFADFELIIWDDASSDGSWEIINTYNDPRIKAFRNDTQKRAVWGINKAILEVAKGEYIAIHHSDDVWEPEKLEKQAAYLDSHPEMGAVFTWARIIGEEGRAFADPDHFYFRIFEQPSRPRFEWLNHFFYRGNALCHPSVLIRKRCYDDVGVYRYGFGQIGDFDMWVRLAMKHEIHVMPEKLVRFRVREGEANTSGNRPESHIRGRLEYFQILYCYLGIRDPDEFQRIFPNSMKYFGGTEYDIGFALAMMALDAPREFSHLFGLQLLFEILNDPARAKRVGRIYNFSTRDFLRLNTELDVFSARLRDYTFPQLQAQLTERDAQLAERDAQLAEIYASRSWRLVLILRKLRLWLLPPGSRREVAGRFLSRTLRAFKQRLFRKP